LIIIRFIIGFLNISKGNIKMMYNNQKADSIKESAYFDYFKIFSVNAAETIRKLEITI
jgi:hypothetical protein